MANPAKRRVEGDDKKIVSKRVTHKQESAAKDAGVASGRYTPPGVYGNPGPSPMWVPILMWTFLGLGLLMILLNYVGAVPGGTSGWYLLGGLGLILLGIITATQYR